MSKYTHPELRKRIKNRIMRSDRGAEPGQWSARKSQLLVQEYERAGGGYTREKTENDLTTWTRADWDYVLGDSSGRYLPREVREQLTHAEKLATNKRKRAGRKQHVPYRGRVAKLMQRYNANK